MAAIIYEGAGGGGNLFEGLTFFIMQRVPSRERWKELIEVCGLICGPEHALTDT